MCVWEEDVERVCGEECVWGESGEWICFIVIGEKSSSVKEECKVISARH